MKKKRWQKLRRFVGLSSLEEQRVSTTPEKDLLFKELKLIVNSSFQSMPEKYKQVLLLYYISGLSNKDIAKTLCVPDGTIASRKNYALTLLKQASKGDRL